MAFHKYRSFWKLTLDEGGGTDVPDDYNLTADCESWAPPDVGRDIITANTGREFNERGLGKLTDMTATIILNSNYHQITQIGKFYEFEVEESLVSNDPDEVAKDVVYSVGGRLQLRSLGTNRNDNSPRPCTLTFLVDQYIEKHSDQSTNAYQIDQIEDPPIIKQNGVDMFPA